MLQSVVCHWANRLKSYQTLSGETTAIRERLEWSQPHCFVVVVVVVVVVSVCFTSLWFF